MSFQKLFIATCDGCSRMVRIKEETFGAGKPPAGWAEIRLGPQAQKTAVVCSRECATQYVKDYWPRTTGDPGVPIEYLEMAHDQVMADIAAAGTRVVSVG